MDETNDRSRARLAPEGGEPALHRAARVGDVAGIRRLVEAGADRAGDGQRERPRQVPGPRGVRMKGL